MNNNETNKTTLRSSQTMVPTRTPARQPQEEQVIKKECEVDRQSVFIGAHSHKTFNIYNLSKITTVLTNR
jgi:hypothetical protein